MTIPPTMQALQLRRLGSLTPCVLPVPTPKPDELLIRTRATTICTSDIHDIAHNPFEIALPRVLGHEGAGTVVAMGDNVRGYQVGDRVASHPVISCGACAPCIDGIGHLCENMGHLGFDRDGTFAEYYRVPAGRARPVPEGVDFAVAALLEPVAVCIEAVRRARVAAEETILVAGDGPFGLLIARLCLRESPGCVILAGKEEFRLSRVPGALRINVDRVPDAAAAVRDLSGDAGVHAAILAVANPEAAAMCLQSLRPRGRLVIFSNMPGSMPVDLSRVHIKELEILGACNDENHIDAALACLSDPSLSLSDMVTHRLPFSRWSEALELASHGKHEALKVALTFPEDPL